MFCEADVVSSYTRADAIEDGQLVDVSEVAREAGFTIPVAITRAAWADCVEWQPEDARRKKALQDEQGRLWDVVWMANQAARRNRAAGRVLFQLYRVPRQGRGVKPRLVQLKMIVGAGDGGEPVITIMEPGED